MKDPMQIGRDAWIDREEVAATYRDNGRLIVFLKSGKTVNIDDSFSGEEIEKLVRKSGE